MLTEINETCSVAIDEIANGACAIIKVKLYDGVYLCTATCHAENEYKEVYTYIEKNGMVWQDLALVREAYHYNEKNEVVNDHKKYEVLVYADCGDEDYTNKFDIDEYEDEEEE